MGVSLSYTTAEPVDDAVKAAIVAETAGLQNARDWWCEAITFFAPPQDDGRLHGDTKLFLSGYSTKDGGFVEVSPEEDSLMAYRDACFIIDRLCEWSRKYGLVWTVECAGEEVGVIMGGEPDNGLREFIESFGEPDLFDPNDPTVEDKARAISAKYGSR
jgi:hypothetical protein